MSSTTETYREQVSQRDSFVAAFMHGDQGYECDAFPGEFGNPSTYRAWLAGWTRGHDNGQTHRPGVFDHSAAEDAYQQWRAATGEGS